MAIQIVATVELPARQLPFVQLTIDGADGRFDLIGHDTAGRSWPVREGQNVNPGADGHAIRRDYEAPFGRPVWYTAREAGQNGDSDASNRVTIETDGAWLYDPNEPGAGIAVELLEIPSMTLDTRGSLVPVIGRRAPVAILARPATPAFTVQLRHRIRDLPPLLSLLGTGEALLFRSCIPVLSDLWFVPQRTRVDKAGPDRAIRTVNIDGQTVDRPSGMVTDEPDSLAWIGVSSAWPSWDALVADRASWRALVEDPIP
jgi:hypothetical protein